MELDARGKLLRAALGFLSVKPAEPELVALHRCFDNWRGIGDVVTGMKRQGYEVSLGDHGSGQWLTTFYEGHGGYQQLNAAGTARAPTPWEAVQRAALDALLKRDAPEAPPRDWTATDASPT